MAIIDPVGFLCGERIGSCSDEAQYHWPRLVAASNSFGRLELSYDQIISVVYGSIKKKPSEEKIMSLLAEYRDNWLLFIYETPEGDIWGEWLIPDHVKARYHSAADRRSPAPPPEALESYRQAYLEHVRSKKAKSNGFKDILKPLANFQNVSQDSQLVCEGSVVAVVVDGVEKDSVGSTKTSTTTPQAAFVLPEWVPVEPWEAFVAMRKRIRAPMSDRAKRNIIRDLDALRCRGHDPGTVLDISEKNNWRGVFEPKGTAGGNYAAGRGNLENRARAAPTDSWMRGTETISEELAAEIRARIETKERKLA